VNSGDLAAIGAVAAAIVALLAYYFTVKATKASERAASAAEAATTIQQRLQIDAAQPYVWADLRVDEQQGVLLRLVVGNSGPTVATDIKVKIDPPFPATEKLQDAVAAQERLAEGFASLPPGRTLNWSLGQGWALVPKDGSQVHTITITANGPFGPIPQLTYAIDLGEFRDQEASLQGNLHDLTQVVQQVNDTLGHLPGRLALELQPTAPRRIGAQAATPLESGLPMRPLNKSEAPKRRAHRHHHDC